MTLATEDFLKLIGAQSNHVQSFQGYGSTFMKESGFSPDAYVQVAMQLATYRLFGEQVGTYEAAQVRPFLHGRTETARSVSTASENFVKRMGLRPSLDETNQNARGEKIHLLQEAAKAHSEYTKIAAQAQGVDRHFLGLGMLVRDGESAPSLLGDPVFVRSKRWRLSTSHLTHPNFKNWGFGQGKFKYEKWEFLCSHSKSNLHLCSQWMLSDYLCIVRYVLYSINLVIYISSLP